MKRTNPLLILTCVFTLSTLGVLVRDMVLLTAVAVYGFVLSLLFRAGIGSTLKAVRRLVPLLLGIALVQSIFTVTGEPVVTVYGFVLVRDEGLFRAVQFILRMLVLAEVTTILKASDFRDMIAALDYLRIPYELSFMVCIGVRLIPIFRDELKDSVTALELYGVDFRHIPLRKKMSVYSYMLMPQLVRCLKRVDALSASMEVRGFRAHDRRTSYRVLTFKARDILYIMLLLFVFVAALLLYYF